MVILLCWLVGQPFQADAFNCRWRFASGWQA
jgi:hypothetical protein